MDQYVHEPHDPYTFTAGCISTVGGITTIGTTAAGVSFAGPAAPAVATAAAPLFIKGLAELIHGGYEMWKGY